jgi:Predicted metal-dependent hydrolase with the TIM-barrel fold
MKKAMTVLGPIEGKKLGHVLPHEHILMKFPESNGKHMYPELADKKVAMEFLGKIRRDIWSCRDNLVLDDANAAREEVTSFRQKGGGTIVDVTTIGLSRNIKAIRKIAEDTGVNIIAGTGYYSHTGHPEEVGKLSIEELATVMFKEIREGIEDTGVKAGIIGEIGVSTPIHPQEEKVLRAAARTHKRTGAPLSIHQFGGGTLDEIDEILAEEEVEPAGVILCHMCSASGEQRLWAAEKGYYVEIDGFGNEYYSDALAGIIQRDPDRIQMVRELCEKGYVKRVLVSNDVALKILTKKYGGWGYEHIIANIKPFMLRSGVPAKAVDSIIYYNPARAVAYLD